MLEQVRAATGEVLTSVESYIEDVGQYWGNIERFDKLERRQDFQQPENSSWRAFAAGHWEESLRRLQKERPNTEAEYAEDARLGLVSHRVRVVEFPVIPYVQWELHALKIRTECGENIRIIGPELISANETSGSLPELIFMGTQAMYEVLYDAAGVLAGGRKFTDPELITGCLAEVQALYARGEDLSAFFEREIALLPPPDVNRIPSPSSRP